MRVPLPPLPAIGKSAYRPGGRSVIDVLTAEHDEAVALCAMLAEPGLPPRRRRQVAEVLTAVVTRHLSAEEQYFLPAVRCAVDGGALADRELAADAKLRHALRVLRSAGPDSPTFPVRCALVAALVRRHVRAANHDLFPALRSTVSPADLIRLGNRVEVAIEAAPTRPHPAIPHRPPWNRIVDPAVGLVDKLRDMLTGRRTYVADLSWRPRMW